MARKQPTDKPADPTGEPIATAAAPGTPPPMPLAPLLTSMANRVIQLEQAERQAAETLLLIRGRLAEARDALSHAQGTVGGATGA